MPPATPITLVLARFDDLIAGGLRELVARDASILTVAGDVEHDRLSVVLRGHRPDVAILDAGALVKLVEVQELSRAHPGTSLVLLIKEPSGAECAQLLAFGASACLGTDAQGRDVLNAVHLASRGLRLTPRDLPTVGEDHYIRDSGQPLTRREGEVLPLLRQGRSNAEIALALHVGVETVRTHTRNIYRKLGVSSRRELVAPPRPQPSDPQRAPAPQPRQRSPMPTLSRRPGHGSRQR